MAKKRRNRPKTTKAKGKVPRTRDTGRKGKKDSTNKKQRTRGSKSTRSTTKSRPPPKAGPEKSSATGGIARAPQGRKQRASQTSPRPFSLSARHRRISFERAVDNVARYGDTDIFPHPIEKHVLYDCKSDTVELLLRADDEFWEEKASADGSKLRVESFLARYPPVNASVLSPVGYTGFRWATQIDPFWNAYLLGLVIAAAGPIEAERLPHDDKVIYSYRYKWNEDSASLSDNESGWSSFVERSRELAQHHSHVLLCDISDFYPRINHHRLENALSQVVGETPIPRKIDKLIGVFSNTKSYGLPVGGPASRLLAELVLNSTDRLLRMNRIAFCRFADDFHIFAKSKEEAYRNLIFLAEKLMNEGLSLQKSKTRIMRSTEFIATSAARFGHEEEEIDELEARQFLNLRIHFDPYSEDPARDYEEAKENLKKFDIVGMLTKELEKSRVHTALTKQILRAVQFLEPPAIETTARVLIESLETLAPVFSRVMVVFQRLLPTLTEDTRQAVWQAIRDLIQRRSYITQVQLNLMYAARVLGAVWTVENEAMLADLYSDNRSGPLLRKDIILIMGKWGNYHWVSDVLQRFSSLDAWDRRACIVSSYCLKDEGSHWRDHNKAGFSPFESLVLKWAGTKSNDRRWKIPI